MRMTSGSIAAGPPLEEWISSFGAPAGQLDFGGMIADVGCADGTGSIRLARRFPLASVRGFDLDGSMLDGACRAAAEARVDARCRFAVAAPEDIPAGAYDVVCLRSGLGACADPRRAALRCRKVVASGGVVMVVEHVQGVLVAVDLLRRSGYASVDVVAATTAEIALAARP